MKPILSILIVWIVSSVAFLPSSKTNLFSSRMTKSGWNHQYQMSSHVDLFGGNASTSTTTNENEVKSSIPLTQAERLKLSAQKLRQEAAELEIALREEARSKGLPEEMINKLIPLRQTSSSGSKPIPSTSSTSQVIDSPSPSSTISSSSSPIIGSKLASPDELKTKIGYLNTQDPVRFVTELQRIKMKGYLKLWDSVIPTTNYNVNAYQLKANCDIDPSKLRLDEVGYDYKMVLVSAIAIGTIFGLSSSQIGGQTGFILGYLSALIPIVVVGVGSIAPALIGDILLNVRTSIDEKLRDQLLTLSAGKFLVGYCLGLPISRFDSSSLINTVEFYQLKPTGLQENEQKQYFTKKTYSQNDIARSSATCIAGPVAECIHFGESSGNAAADVNTLQQLVLAIEPALNPDGVQNHIRWSAMTAHSILKNRQDELNKLKQAFREKKSLEECISIIEGVSTSLNQSDVTSTVTSSM